MNIMSHHQLHSRKCFSFRNLYYSHLFSSTETQSTNTIITSITTTTSTSTTTSNAQIRFNYIYIQSYKLYLVFFILAYFYI